MRFHWFWSHVSMILGALSGIAMIGNAFELRPTVAPALQWTFYIDIGFAITYTIVCLWAFCLRNKRTPTAWYLMLTPPLMRIAYAFTAIFLYKKLGVETINLWSQILVYSTCWILVFVYYYKRKSLFFDRIHYDMSLLLILPRCKVKMVQNSIKPKQIIILRQQIPIVQTHIQLLKTDPNTAITAAPNARSG